MIDNTIKSAGYEAWDMRAIVQAPLGLSDKPFAKENLDVPKELYCCQVQNKVKTEEDASPAGAMSKDSARRRRKIKIMINSLVKYMNTARIFRGRDGGFDMQIKCLRLYARMFLTCLFLFLSVTIPYRVLSVELPENNISAKEMFNKVQDKLVIVDGSNGRGSGFVAKASDGVKYFYTNKHVVEGQRKIAARLLNGQEIQLGNFQYAEDCDVVRFEINDIYPALEFELTTPMIGDKVFVFGNSAGAGVATEITGEILGVGPSSIEISNRFVPGNSGSAVLNQDGKIVAIATYVAIFAEKNDWRFLGTRYADIRRFGIRVMNAKWKSCEFNDFVEKGILLEKQETLKNKNDDTRTWLRYLNSKLAQYMASANRIYTAKEVLDNVKKSRSAALRFRDAWDNEFHFEIVTNQAILTSLGADQLFGTSDDLSITNYCAYSQELQDATADREHFMLQQQQFAVSRRMSDMLKKATGFEIDEMYDVLKFPCCLNRLYNVEMVGASGSVEPSSVFVGGINFMNYHVSFTAKTATAFSIEVETDGAYSMAAFQDFVGRVERDVAMKMNIHTNLILGQVWSEVSFLDGRSLRISRDQHGKISCTYSNDATLSQVIQGFEASDIEKLPKVEKFLGMPIGSSFEPIIPRLKNVRKSKKSVKAEFTPAKRFLDFGYYEVEFSTESGEIGIVRCEKLVSKETGQREQLYNVMKAIEGKYGRQFHLEKNQPNDGGAVWSMHFIKPREYPKGEIGFGEYDIEFELCLAEVPQRAMRQSSVVMLIMFVPHIAEQMIEENTNKSQSPVDAL